MNPRWSTPIPDQYAGEVLRWYEGLEAQVMDFIRLVPPHGPHNLNSWSSQLATVLVEACCLIESIFYQFRDDAAIEQGKTIRKAKPGKRLFLTLKDYAELYGSLLRLPERTVILLTDTPNFRTPFSLWTNAHVPAWWDLYNSSKHGRFEVFTKFTLTRAIDALAGALIVISTVPAFAPALLRHEWLPLGSWNPEALVPDYCQTLRGQHSTSSEWPFTIETRLFALPIGHSQLPLDTKDFRPLFYGASPRLLRWFGKI